MTSLDRLLVKYHRRSGRKRKAIFQTLIKCDKRFRGLNTGEIIAKMDLMLLKNQEIPQVINTAKNAFDILKPYFNPDAEEFWGIMLNHNLELIKIALIHRGTSSSCKIHPRDLFREAVRCNAYGIIIAHNHTSSSVQPSFEDIRITKKLIKCGQMLEVPIIDHVIFNYFEFQSFKESRLI